METSTQYRKSSTTRAYEAARMEDRSPSFTAQTQLNMCCCRNHPPIRIRDESIQHITRCHTHPLPHPPAHPDKKHIHVQPLPPQTRKSKKLSGKPTHLFVSPGTPPPSLPPPSVSASASLSPASSMSLLSSPSRPLSPSTSPDEDDNDDDATGGACQSLQE